MQETCGAGYRVGVVPDVDYRILCSAMTVTIPSPKLWCAACRQKRVQSLMAEVKSVWERWLGRDSELRMHASVHSQSAVCNAPDVSQWPGTPAKQQRPHTVHEVCRHRQEWSVSARVAVKQACGTRRHAASVCSGSS